MPNRTRIILFLTLFVFSSLILITINAKGNRQPKFIEIAVSAFISPLQKAVTNSINSVNLLWVKYLYLVGVEEENIRLQAEIGKIKSLQNKLTEIKLEHKRLLDLLEIKETSPQRMMVAKIIGFDATNWNQVVVIDKGSDNGVKRKMPVVSDTGLIGKIESTTLRSSKVLLITDVRNAVDAIIQESRAKGIVVGTNQEICDMKYVSLEDKVKKGHHIISSGLGGIYPKGLLLGVVEKAERKKIGLFHEVSVKPSADLDHLEEVLIILD